MGNKVYIVDYDIPEEPAKKRVQFYRDLKKISVLKCDYSTLSVIRTSEKEVAEAVWLLVMAHGGNAHMYVATEIFPGVG
ncbi:MAG: hypothetical protein HXS46_20600 [Theionarchaea archaeon]|nr:hypothetical protein [Theionarchaea archaeon]